MQNRMEYTNSRLLDREKSAIVPQIFTNCNRTCIPDCLHYFFFHLKPAVFGKGVGVVGYAVSKNSEKTSNSSDNQLVFTKPDMVLSHCVLRGEKRNHAPIHQYHHCTSLSSLFCSLELWVPCPILEV